jgi:hypothetical protein
VRLSGDQVPPLSQFYVFTKSVPPEAARERFLAVADAVLQMPEGQTRWHAFDNLLPAIQGREAFWTDVVLPVLGRIWPRCSSEERLKFLRAIDQYLTTGAGPPELRKAFARVALDHLADVRSDTMVPRMLVDPDLFPYEQWVPRVAASSVQTGVSGRVPRDKVDAALREMTKDPAAVTESVVAFMKLWATPDAKREISDRLMRTLPAEHLGWLWNYGPLVASTEAVADAYDRVVAATPPNLDALSRLVPVLCAVSPTEKLFPGVRLLLASPDNGHVRAGVAAAKSLGREELLPALGAKLDSMDVSIRGEAQAAIDAITALRKLREEARKQGGASSSPGR